MTPRWRDRMAGVYARLRCPVCRAAAGPDCAAAGHAVRDQRHADKAALRRYAGTVVQEEAAAVDADNDPSDCRHGCNGECVVSGSEKCSFFCHPHLRKCLMPGCGRVMERHEFHDHENGECSGYWGCTRCAYTETFRIVGCTGG